MIRVARSGGLHLLVLLALEAACAPPPRAADDADGGPIMWPWPDAAATDAQPASGCHPLFDPQQIYAAHSYPNAVAVADLDGDHHPDLAITNYMNQTVTLRFNHGDGTFPSEATHPVGQGPCSLIIDDRDGDGNLDLVVANLQGDSLSLLFGTGQGAFAPQIVYPMGASPAGVRGPSALVTADFNGDQKSDLAVANEYEWTASVLLGSGPSDFVLQGGFATARLPVSMVANDFNGDGKVDLALANNNQDQVSVLLGRGDGTFEPQQMYPAGQYSVGIAAGDLNGDGHVDLAVANFYNQNTLSILLNDGSGTFTTAQTNFPSANAADAIALADLDRDGSLDLLVVNALHAGTLVVLHGNGDGTFTEEGTYAVGDLPVSVMATDLDGDGWTDAVVANAFSDSVSVLRNRCAPEPATAAASH